MAEIIPAMYQVFYNHGVHHWEFSLKYLYYIDVMSSNTPMKKPLKHWKSITLQLRQDMRQDQTTDSSVSVLI